MSTQAAAAFPPVASAPNRTAELRALGSPVVLSTAELAPCTCPEPCERDHDRD